MNNIKTVYQPKNIVFNQAIPVNKTFEELGFIDEGLTINEFKKNEKTINIPNYFVRYNKNENGKLILLPINEVNDIIDFMDYNKMIRILFYTNNANDLSEYIVTYDLFLQFSNIDIVIIKKDFELINAKIQNGEFSTISEADTLYLTVCNVNTETYYCLKKSYVSQLIQKYLNSSPCLSMITENLDTNNTFEEIIIDRITPFIGLSQEDLCNLFKVKMNPKNINQLLLGKMLRIGGNLGQNEEFMKANIVPKTIRIEHNSRIKESMSFPAFRYIDIVNENWQNSELRNMFFGTKFLFVMFQKVNEKYIFRGIKFWNMPISILDKEVYKVWSKTVQVIKSGNIVKYISEKGIRYTNFPGIKENFVSHVRPHAQNRDDVYELPIKDILTGLKEYPKHCFWLNNKYLESILLH